jgi:hypothetical protein
MNSPRRWFQIHLSTFMVLVFLLGLIIWMNLIPENPLSILLTNRDHKLITGSTAGECFKFGWPIQCIYYLAAGYYQKSGFVPVEWYYMGHSPLSALISLILNAVLVAAVYTLLEVRIKRRQKQFR